MRVPYNWLREYVPIELDPQELAEKMTMAGIPVEELDDPGAPTGAVGRSATCNPIPKQKGCWSVGSA